jgi:two-component system NtrC family sensor kinase
LKPINLPILRSKVRIFLDLYAGRRQIADAKLELERKNAELWQLAEAKAALAEQFKQANEKLATAYRELQETQALLVQSAKMASLGELVAGVAHEINNPLSFALGHLRTARNSLEVVQHELGDALPEAAREHWLRAENRLSEMTLGLDRIRELVVKLRTFSRLDEGELKRVSVRESVESVLTILGHRLRDRIEVRTDFCTPDMLDCYAGALNQAIMNLVSNAIDAIEGPGKLTIVTRIEAEEYSISITDTGTGIPEHLRERVLDPFFTTKPAGQGTGLGLSITYSIVRKHGGKLELREADGGGTTAIIRIPRTQ